MADGHLNVCIECVKNGVKSRADKLSDDPAWIEKERARGREKYHRLYGPSLAPIPGEKKKKTMSKYFGNYPEKLKAKTACQKIRTPEGCHKHHWSYKEEHWLDFLILPLALHYKAHRFMRYSQAHKMYTTLSGTLLDTREKHEQYIQSIKDLL